MLSNAEIGEHGYEASSKAWSGDKLINLYENVTRNYDVEAVEFFLEKIDAFSPRSDSQSPFTIVELGAGTGKLTRDILNALGKRSVKNVKIVATDPVKEMCDKFRELTPNVEILERKAHDLHGLPDNCADAVVGAACVHYFSDAASFAEIHRVLKPKGVFGIMWRCPDSSVSWIKNLDDFMKKIYRKKNLNHPDGKAWRAVISANSGFGSINMNHEVSRSNLELDLQGILDLFQGYGGVASSDPDELAAILDDIKREVKTHPETKDKEIYTFGRVIKVEWVQKI